MVVVNGGVVLCPWRTVGEQQQQHEDAKERLFVCVFSLGVRRPFPVWCTGRR